MHLFPSPAHITKARETTPFVANFLLKVFEATEIVPRLRRGRRTSPAEMKISKGMGAHLWEKDASRARFVRQRLLGNRYKGGKEKIQAHGNNACNSHRINIVWR